MCTISSNQLVEAGILDMYGLLRLRSGGCFARTKHQDAFDETLHNRLPYSPLLRHIVTRSSRRDSLLSTATLRPKTVTLRFVVSGERQHLTQPLLAPHEHHPKHPMTRPMVRRYHDSTGSVKAKSEWATLRFIIDPTKRPLWYKDDKI